MSAIYYSDSDLLSEATAIYLDENLTTFAPDGFYSDQFISRRQVTIGGVTTLQIYETCNNCSSPIPSSTLTFDSYSGGYPSVDGAKFRFFLSNSISSADVNITGINIQGWSGTVCTGPPTNIDTPTTTLTISSGTFVNVVYGSGWNCASSSYVYKKVNSIIVNGVTRSHGDTIMIGGVEVLINIDYSSCNTLLCTT